MAKKKQGKSEEVASDEVFDPAFYKFIETVRTAAQEFTDTTNMEVSKLILYNMDGKYHSVDVL